jgi:DNA-binding response OmpR family regulator
MTLYPARSCEEILNLHGVNKADLIIADFALPLMEGAKLCSIIRTDASLKDVSIIMVCDDVERALAECRTTGANAVIPKPVDAIELFSRVSQLLMVQQRLAVRVPLRITVEGRNSKATFVGLSRDLSVSGMLLESGRMLQQGERLECSFTVSSRVVSVDCVVVRAQESPAGTFQYGVKFLNLDAKTFVLVEHFIKSSERET